MKKKLYGGLKKLSELVYVIYIYIYINKFVCVCIKSLLSLRLDGFNLKLSGSTKTHRCDTPPPPHVFPGIQTRVPMVPTPVTRVVVFVTVSGRWGRKNKNKISSQQYLPSKEGAKFPKGRGTPKLDRVHMHHQSTHGQEFLGPRLTVSRLLTNYRRSSYSTRSNSTHVVVFVVSPPCGECIKV